MFDLSEAVKRWKTGVLERGGMKTEDADELESHLDDSIESLRISGLSEEEAFIIAVKRMGSQGLLNEEFRKVNGRFWKDLPLWEKKETTGISHETVLILILGAVSIILAWAFVKIWKWDITFGRLMAFSFVPVITAWLVWKYKSGWKVSLFLALFYGALFILMVLYPEKSPNHTSLISILHMPVLIILTAGLAYQKGRLFELQGWMDFIRYLGEVFIYGVLVGLGLLVLYGLTMALFQVIGIDLGRVFQDYLVFITAAVPVAAAYLAEAKRSVVENFAPVLARIFTPVFTLLLALFLITALVMNNNSHMARDYLMVFNVAELLALGLTVYSISARNHGEERRVSDWLLFTLAFLALAADIVALTAVIGRLAEWGLSPNKLVLLGLNLILLANLAVLGTGFSRFLFFRKPFAQIEKLQVMFIPVFAAWCLFAAVILPPLFGFR